MTRAKDISKILTDADISGDIDVDGVTNLDVVDIDGAVDMASTLTVGGAFTSLGIDDNANATAMTIDSSEYVMIGTTDNSPENNSAGTTDDNGIALSPYGYGSFARYAANSGTGIPLFVNRTNADGSLVEFRKDGTVVGSISAISGDLTIQSTTSGHEGLRFGNGAIVPVNTAGASTNIECTLGGATSRFNNLYLGGGAFLGGTGAANLLDNYEEGTWTPAYSTTNGSFGYDDATEGIYTKIGNTVSVSFRMYTTSATVGTGNVIITGLPFTPTSSYKGAGSIGDCRLFAGDHPSTLSIQANGEIRPYYRTSANGANQALQASDLSTGTTKNLIDGQITYQV